jgi:hypothetical protein
MDPAVDVDGPDPICPDNPYPRFNPGVYEVRCFEAKIYLEPRYRRWVCRLMCHFLTERATVCGFLNMGDGPQPSAGRGSEYWRVWAMTTNQQPRRGRLPKKVFLGRIYRVKIGDTKHDSKQREHSDAAVYSTIKEFVACIGP